MFLSFLLIYELDLLMTVSEPSYITHGNGQFEDHRTKRRTHTHSGPIALCGPLKWSTKLLRRWSYCLYRGAAPVTRRFQ